MLLHVAQLCVYIEDLYIAQAKYVTANQSCCQEDVGKLMQEKVAHLQSTDYLAQMYNRLLSRLSIVFIRSSAHLKLFRIDQHNVIIKSEWSEVC